MTSPRCERLSFDELTAYAAGELSEPDASALEEHLFSCADCGARAAEVDALARAVRSAVRASAVGGFVTDDVLNQFARDGIRVRMFTLTPGAFVPCAVWDDDDLMGVRLRGEFNGAGEIMLSQRVGGTEVARERVPLPASPHGELLHVMPAAIVRQLPEVNIEITLSTTDAGVERTIGTYTLVHAGPLHR
jgi:hypothetical protein